MLPTRNNRFGERQGLLYRITPAVSTLFFDFFKKLFPCIICSNSSASQIVSGRTKGKSPRQCFFCLVKIVKLLVLQSIFQKLLSKRNAYIYSGCSRKSGHHSVEITINNLIDFFDFRGLAGNSSANIKFSRFCQWALLEPIVKIFAVFRTVIPMTCIWSIIRENIADSDWQPTARAPQSVYRSILFFNVTVFFKGVRQKINNRFPFQRINAAVTSSHGVHGFSFFNFKNPMVDDYEI